MHICIPDTREVRPQHGGAYLLYNVHIDGLYHCSLRFKQLLHLHQSLSKKFGSSSSFNGMSHHPLPSFPPKRLLPLSASKVEERRQQLEKYLQNISQDKTIANSSIFNMFLLEAQRESTKLVEPEQHVHLDIELVNGQKIRLPIVTHDSVDSVLTACCRALGLADRYHAYFCLCLCGYDVVRDKLIIKRKLSFFEAPFITLQLAVQQQEQLQSVLSATVNSNNYPNQNQQLTSLSLSSASNSSGLNNNLNNNSNPCRCQSCSARLQQQHATTTGVPLVSSSSSGSNSTSYVDQEQQQMSTNSNHNNLQQQRQCNGNSSQSWQQAMTHSSSGSPFVTHRILLRKSYWDPIYDSYILNDQQALNLLFIQTVYDMKHSLMFVDRETYQQLESLLANDSKLEYILLARRLKYYNYVHFEPCYSDYPRPRTKVMISIGSKELNMRVLKTPAAEPNGNEPNGNHQRQQQEPVLYCTSSLVPNGYRHITTKDDLIEEEYNFKVPLIRCWRLTSLETLNSNGNPQQQREQHRSTATTTIAGGKRKSLSLFNSVVGNSIHSSPPQASTAESNPQLQGFGGSSLMATLGATSDNQHHQQTSSRRTSTTSIGSNSFFNFRSNSNQQSQSNGCDGPTTHCQNENQTQHHKQHPRNAAADVCDQTQLSQYELSFEYLIAKDTLKWITISSDQAIFISISLQGVVDELVLKRELGACMGDVGRVELSTNGTNSQQQLQVSRPISIQRHRQSGNSDRQPTPESFTYMYQDGGQKLIRAKSLQPLESFSLGHSPPSSATNYSLALAARHHRMAAASSSNGGYMATPQSRSSTLLQAASLWGSGSHDTPASSPPGRYYGHQSSSGLNGGNYHSPHTVGSSFEISQFNKKAPSPIINDAFEGVVTNDDDL